jgi:ubiquinone/menaquinone biosynthesis C-methylase UbiE
MRRSESRKNPAPYDVENRVESFHWWFVVRRRLLKSILSSIKVPENSLTLDIGCGTGSNLRVLSSVGLYPIGLDQSTYALNLVKTKWKFPFLAGDLSKLPIKTNSIGLIIATDILEHLEDDEDGIREIHRVLNKGGTLILTVPAFTFLWGIQDAVTGHKRRYSKREVVKKLRGVGFEISRSSYFNFLLFLPILIARRLIRLLGLKIESENEINFPLINFLLKGIFSLEIYALKYFSFPFGVSVFCIAKKS